MAIVVTTLIANTNNGDMDDTRRHEDAYGIQTTGDGHLLVTQTGSSSSSVVAIYAPGAWRAAAISGEAG